MPVKYGKIKRVKSRVSAKNVAKAAKKYRKKAGTGTNTKGNKGKRVKF